MSQARTIIPESSAAVRLPMYAFATLCTQAIRHTSHEAQLRAGDVRSRGLRSIGSSNFELPKS